MRTCAHILLLGAVSCASGPIDLGEIVGGKGDVSSIDVPLALDGNGAEAFTLTADRPFEVSVEGDRLLLSASAGERRWASAGEPRLVIDVEASTAVELTVRNLAPEAVRTRLRIVPAAAECADGVYLAWLDSVKHAFTSAGSFIDETEAGQLEAILGSRPCTPTSDTAYVAWFLWYLEAFTAAGNFIDADETARLAYVVRARAEGAGGDASYAAWANEMAQLGAGAGSVADENETQRLEVMLSVKPCASVSPATQTALTQISTAMSAEIAAAWVPQLAPEACR